MMKRVSLNAHLVLKNVPHPLRHLILEIARAAKYIQFAIRTTETGLNGSVNQFGEEQVKLDVLSDETIQAHLRESGEVACFISEEQSEVIEINPKAPYSVVYDPLDGSSLVDVNFAIGSIFGIYEGKELLGRTPREQVAALYVLYGPRTILVVGSGDGVHEFVLNEVGEFMLLREYLGVGDDAKIFSPGNVTAVNDNPAYKQVLDDWLKRSMTLRYSGCMVSDVHQILSKGQGIFSNIGGNKYPQGKLRLVFECGPLSYLVEQAGGSSSDGSGSLLGKKIESIDQRTPIIIGSKNDVEKVAGMLST